MNCSKHKDREAVGMCVRCNSIICEDCAVKINNKYYCKDCVSKMYSNNNSRNYNYNNNNTNTINVEKVKEYADKAVGATVEATNDALNLVKDFSESEEFKSTVNKAKDNYKVVKYILGIIAILILLPKATTVLGQMPYVFEELIFSFRYYGVFRAIFYIINVITTFIQPLIVIALATLLFNNFMRLKREIRMIAPVIIVALFTAIKFVSANIAYSYFSFHVIGDMFSYVIPVVLIVIGSYLDKEV